MKSLCMHWYVNSCELKPQNDTEYWVLHHKTLNKTVFCKEMTFVQ